MEILTIGYIVFLTLLMATLSFSFLLVKYYTHPSESYTLATVTTTLSFSLTLSCVLLVPIDIFITSSRALNIPQDTLMDVLTGLLILMLVLAFVLIPFVYFYGEETYDEIDSDYENQCERVCEASKYTAGFMLICSVLIIIGLLFRPDKEH